MTGRNHSSPGAFRKHSGAILKSAELLCRIFWLRNCGWEVRHSSGTKPVDIGFNRPGGDIKILRLGDREAFVIQFVRRCRTDIANLRSEEHTSELQSLRHLVCRLLL